ncbi:hypothetical protein BGZ79_004072 [Entomortierella chlamydospora]|nr:hypothetical protein BGZ79_004072 [Entomortierella chlamydospora]
MSTNSISVRTEFDILDAIGVIQKTRSWLNYKTSVVKHQYAYLLECSEEGDNINAMSRELVDELNFFKKLLDHMSQQLQRLRHELFNAAARPFSLEVVNQLVFVNTPDPVKYSLDEYLTFWD